MENTKTLSIIAIGTEVINGEVLNSNATWLAAKVDDLGFEVKRHLTVRDDPDDIKQALSFCEDSDVIITTGGLGPTTDDLSRASLAQWCAQKLYFHQDSYEYLKKFLELRGRRVLEGHKHQCYFPENSLLLENKAGTAQGFCLTTLNNKLLVSLPGPPREIESIWKLSLKEKLLSMNSIKKKQLFQMRYFGIGRIWKWRRWQKIFLLKAIWI